jgi:hypothetical protein
MPRNVYEVLVGAGTLYTAPVSTAFPANPATSPSGSWTEIGYSNDGWTFAIDPKAEPIVVEEEMDPLFILRTTMEIHLRGSSAQSSIANLQLALGGGSIVSAAGPPATLTYTPPLVTDQPTEMALLLRGKAPAQAGVAKTRDIQIPRAVSLVAVEYQQRKAPNLSMLAMDWRLLRPTSGATFTWVDLT